MSLENQLVMPDHVSDVKVTRTSVEEMVSKILADKLKANRETKLTWSDRGKRVPQDKVSGEFNGRLEYIRIGRGVYWIQNGKLFDGAKKRIKMEDVDSYYKPFVEEAFENFKKQAIAADDALCPRCLDRGEPFVAESHEEYAKHVMNVHPAIALEKLDSIPVATRVSPAPELGESVFKVETIKATPKVFTTEKADTPRSNFICLDCGKNTPTHKGLLIHTSRVHSKK